MAQSFSDLPLEHMPLESPFGYSLAAGDIDGDLDIDLLYATEEGGGINLHRNLGGGRFSTTLLPGMQVGTVFGVAIGLVDTDGDGDLDLIAGRGVYRPMQWRNDGGVFVDATLSRMPNYTSLFSPTGVVPGDIDGDGDTDLVLTGNGSILLRNQGGGVFVLAVAQMPLTVPSIFGGALVDIDGDGDRDFVAAQRWHQVPGRHLCYVNNGLGQFTNQSAARLPATTEFYGGGSGMATGDIDGDGDVDLIAPQANGEVSVYRNNGVGSFLDRQSIPLQGITHAPYESSPTLLRLADVDADGALDLLFVNDGGYGRHLLRNDGTGQFIPAPPDSLPQSRTAVTDQAFVDLDADGDLDLTQSTHLFNSLSLRFRAHVLMLNDGRGHFVDIGREAIDQVFDELRCQVAVDFDKDGLPDLVRGVQTSTEGDGFGMLWTERNRGDLTFLSHGRIAYDQTLGVPTVLAAADVDADGWDDLYVGMNTAQHLLLLGQGGGRFQPGGSLPPITTSAKAALFGDFDRDGDVDLITPRSGPSSTQGQTQFWANDGLGNFTEQTTQRLPTLVDEVWCSEAFDLEPDGDLDVFLGVWSSQQAPGDRLLINDGSGVFSNEPNRLPYPMVAWEAARASKAADFDGDGRVDLAVQRSIGGLLVLRGTAAGSFVDVSQQWNPFGLSCPAIHLADFDGDGRVDVLRLGYDSMLLRNTGSSLQLISGHTTTPFVIQSLPQFPAVGDFDSDGDTDIVFGSAGFGHAQWNLRRQLSMPMLAMPGQPLPIRVHARTGSSPPSFAAVVAIATARERSQTPFGTCWFDPGSLLSLHAVLAPAGAGMAEFVVDIPPWNFLQGTELTVQALMFGAGSPSPALTNAITTGIR